MDQIVLLKWICQISWSFQEIVLLKKTDSPVKLGFNIRMGDNKL